MERLTPLLTQYKKLKARYKDALLLFRMGDFYETFYEDAELAARVLGITLTSRPHGKGPRVPLAGIPYRSLEGYLSKLVAAGYKVAICEQLEDPRQARGLVHRDVVEVITPGTVMRPELLEESRNCFLLSLLPKERIGLALAELSTGELKLGEISKDDLWEVVREIEPKEVIYPEGSQLNMEGAPPIPFTPRPDYAFEATIAYERLLRQLGVASLAGFGCEDKPLGIAAAGGLLEYIDETQRQALPHLRRISLYSRDESLLLDAFTRRNLELTESLKDGSRDGTLLQVLDHTRTPPGARLLRRWLVAPSRDLKEIERRQEAVAELIASPYLRQDLDEIMKRFGDLERLSARVACERVLPRELTSLKGWLELVPTLKEVLKETRAEYLSPIQVGDFTRVVELIDRVLVNDPPPVINEGGLIKPGVNPELDELRSLSQDAKRWLEELQERERRRTRIPNLRVGYNSVFGYYIEVTRSHLNLVPKEYIRRQTLTGAERFITPELKDYESKILNAEDRIRRLEYELFIELRQKLAGYALELQSLSQVMARLDLFCSLARVAVRNEYTRPHLDHSSEIVIHDGRHPVVERCSTTPFVPNDTRLDLDSNQILLITGPNMAGKSTYLRQVALIVVMAQIGSFVPAREARLGLVDRIFTRIGASDDLARGVSTFLAEMMETANILNNATPKSLVILDEIGRGTATYDGLAIAWAVVEYLHENPKLRPKTLFATHYHELTDIARFLPRVKNYSILVKEHQNQVLFLRKLVPGRVNRSYGIEVARLAGFPPEVLNRAKEVLAGFEQGEELSMSSLAPERPFQLSLFYPVEHPILEELRKLKLDNLPPIQALNLLAEWQERLRVIPNRSPEG